jgi:hypothetical protein
MKIIDGYKFREKWDLFLKSKYPEFSYRYITNYFGIKDVKYYPKRKYVKQLQNEFLELCEQEDLWVDYTNVHGSLVKVKKREGENYENNRR